MPMFYVPKPRQFNYRPRFYDPHKERLEELKRKYAQNPDGASPEDMEYFERRVKEIDDNDKRSKLTWKDMFRKRKMPKFEYKSRFSTENGSDAAAAPAMNAEEHVEQFKESTTKIQRRFDFHKTFQRDQFRVGVVIVIVVVCGYFLYRYFDGFVQSLANLFF